MDVKKTNRPSWSSRTCEKLLYLYNKRNRNRTVEESRKEVEYAEKINSGYNVPQIWETRYKFKNVKFEYGSCSYPVCFYNGGKKLTIIYFHGGAFLYQPLPFHFSYCNKIAKYFSATVYMPIYPKAPANTYRETLGMLASFYREKLSEGLNPNNTVFMGDSSGGNLSLSLAAYLSGSGTPLPRMLISYSPCLEMDMDVLKSGEAIADPLINPTDICVKLPYYTRGGDLKSPYISPFYADYKVLPPTLVFWGTHELLCTSCRAFRDKVKDIESVKCYEFAGQNHVFPLFPIPEANECLKIIREELDSAQKGNGNF